jgi:hypothetical protein
MTSSGRAASIAAFSTASPEFQRQTVEIAARTKLNLTFADPKLERLRRQLHGLPSRPRRHRHLPRAWLTPPGR